MKKKKAFTLVEMSVVLSVSVIIISIIVSLAILISNTQASNAYQTTCSGEYDLVKSMVEEYSQTYSTNEYFDKTVTSNGLKISGSDRDFELVYNKDENKLSVDIFSSLDEQTTEKTKVFENITDIVFTTNDNLVKCEVSFLEYPTFSFVFEFGV
jgi:competence protein ComGC